MKSQRSYRKLVWQEVLFVFRFLFRQGPVCKRSWELPLGLDLPLSPRANTGIFLKLSHWEDLNALLIQLYTYAHTHTKVSEAFGALRRGLRAEVRTQVLKVTNKSMPKNVDYQLAGF